LFYATICDKLEPKYIWIKPAVAAGQALLAAICYFFIYYFFFNFWFALFLVAVEEFLCEGTAAPSLSMMTLTAPPGLESAVMSMFMIITSLAILITSVILGLVVSLEDPLSKVQLVLTFSIVPCFLLASFCFFMSGFDYEKKMN
jgi:predicted MFS family arabinose efflux permease